MSSLLLPIWPPWCVQGIAKDIWTRTKRAIFTTTKMIWCGQRSLLWDQLRNRGAMNCKVQWEEGRPLWDLDLRLSNRSLFWRRRASTWGATHRWRSPVLLYRKEKHRWCHAMRGELTSIWRRLAYAKADCPHLTTSLYSRLTTLICISRTHLAWRSQQICPK